MSTAPWITGPRAGDCPDRHRSQLIAVLLILCTIILCVDLSLLVAQFV